jgi:hypothetical protein
MRFGLLYEAQRPFTGTTVDWNTLYKETLEYERVLQSIEMFGKHVIPACRTEARAQGALR